MKLRKIQKNMQLIHRNRNTLSHKIDFTAYGLHRDYPPAWELNYLKKLTNNFNFKNVFLFIKIQVFLKVLSSV